MIPWMIDAFGQRTISDFVIIMSCWQVRWSSIPINAGFVVLQQYHVDYGFFDLDSIWAHRAYCFTLPSQWGVVGTAIRCSFSLQRRENFLNIPLLLLVNPFQNNSCSSGSLVLSSSGSANFFEKLFSKKITCVGKNISNNRFCSCLVFQRRRTWSLG